jgi:hypothetical protein
MSLAPFFLRSSPAQLLDGAGSELEPLLTRRARQRLLDGAAKLELPARTLCLECRLSPNDDRVDLALCLATQTANLEAALRSIGQRYIDNRSWERCAALLADWAGGHDATLAGVPFLYTAFDLAADPSSLPVPCLSLCADPSFFMRSLDLPVPRAALDWPLRLLDHCSANLALDWVSPELRERARACLTSVEDTEVRQLSLMLSRTPSTLKLDVTIPRSDLEQFLRDNDWGGEPRPVSDALHWFSPEEPRVQFNYVVPSGPPSRSLEVELCCTGSASSSSDQRAAVLDRLVSRGLASSEKAQALLELTRRPSIVDDVGTWLARNWYLKVRFDGDTAVDAKAYIGVSQRSTSAPASLMPGVTALTSP